MATVERSIEVNVPVSTAYNQWTQFEEFPRFMEGVEQVQQLDDKRLHWHAEIAGKDKEWDAEIVEQTRDERVSWRSTSGALNAGTVTFQPMGDRTRVNLVMEYDPEGFLENVGSFLGVVGNRVEGDLERFKEFIESRGTETGAWRGEVHGGQTEGSSSASTSAALSAGAASGSASDFGATSGTRSASTGDYASTNIGSATSAGSSTFASTGAGDVASTDSTAAESGDVTVPIVEEELHVGKREVESGGVRVSTRVEETPVQEQVTLREEHVEVERRPVDRPVSQADLSGVEGEIEISATSEEAVVSKDARVVEEVAIRKDVEQRAETIQDTVRRTDVDVEETGGTARTSAYTESSDTSFDDRSGTGRGSSSGSGGTSTR